MKEIEIYKTKEGKTQIEVKFEGDTVWLTQSQITDLFQRDRTVVTKHINNIFKEGELEEKSNVQKMHIANSDKPVVFYNLDVIISVGYRVKSKQATQFRQWATQRLKDYLVKGYAINEQKLKASQEQFNSLKQSIQLLQNVVSKKQMTSDEAVGLLKVVSEYAQALELLDQYDHQRLAIPETKK